MVEPTGFEPATFGLLVGGAAAKSSSVNKNVGPERQGFFITSSKPTPPSPVMYTPPNFQPLSSVHSKRPPHKKLIGSISTSNLTPVSAFGARASQLRR